MKTANKTIVWECQPAASLWVAIPTLQRYEQKMKYILVIVMMFYSSAMLACPLDPIAQTAKQAEWEYKQADYVFLGKITSFDDLKEHEQIVTFYIEKTFKGPELNSVTIVNMLNSSCSRAFIEKGSSYYVFAKLKNDGNYVIEGNATFVPVKLAEKYDIKLDKAHNNHLHPTQKNARVK